MSTSQLYTHHSRPVGFSSPTPKHPLTSYVSCPYTNKTCVWSGKKLKRNAWFYKYTKETRILLFKYLMQLIPYIQINEYIVNDILDYILPKSYATPLFMYVDYESLLGNLIRNEVVQHAFNKTNLLAEPKTKSGRRIKAPDRFSNKEYLKALDFRVVTIMTEDLLGKITVIMDQNFGKKKVKQVHIKKMILSLTTMKQNIVK